MSDHLKRIETYRDPCCIEQRKQSSSCLQRKGSKQSLGEASVRKYLVLELAAAFPTSNRSWPQKSSKPAWCMVSFIQHQFYTVGTELVRPHLIEFMFRGLQEKEKWVCSCTCIQAPLAASLLEEEN